jgi:hypothetical protein
MLQPNDTNRSFWPTVGFHGNAAMTPMSANSLCGYNANWVGFIETHCPRTFGHSFVSWSAQERSPTVHAADKMRRTPADTVKNMTKKKSKPSV